MSGAGSAEVAIAAVSALEARLADGSLSDYLADDARVNRAGAPPAIGRAAAAAFAPVQSVLPPLRAEASSAGDMVFTLGEARWSANDAELRGHYARIWQLRPEGWRIVFDEVIPRPAPPG